MIAHIQDEISGYTTAEFEIAAVVSAILLQGAEPAAAAAAAAAIDAVAEAQTAAEAHRDVPTLALNDELGN